MSLFQPMYSPDHQINSFWYFTDLLHSEQPHGLCSAKDKSLICFYVSYAKKRQSEQAKEVVLFCLRHYIFSNKCCANAGRLWVRAHWYSWRMLSGECWEMLLFWLFLCFSSLMKIAEICLTVPSGVFWRITDKPGRSLSIIMKNFTIGHVNDHCWATGWHHCIILGLMGDLLLRNIRKMPPTQTRKTSKRDRLDNLGTKMLAVPL